jgi:hypothetical protein
MSTILSLLASATSAVCPVRLQLRSLGVGPRATHHPVVDRLATLAEPRPSFGPATNPSTDIEMSTTTGPVISHSLQNPHCPELWQAAWLRTFLASIRQRSGFNSSCPSFDRPSYPSAYGSVQATRAGSPDSAPAPVERRLPQSVPTGRRHT